MRTENIYSEDLVQRKTKLIFLDIYLYHKNNTNAEQFLHNKENIFGVTEEIFLETLEGFYGEQIQARPSTYCLEPINASLTK